MNKRKLSEGEHLIAKPAVETRPIYRKNWDDEIKRWISIFVIYSQIAQTGMPQKHGLEVLRIFPYALGLAYISVSYLARRLLLTAIWLAVATKQ
jgi:hypothetical protein